MESSGAYSKENNPEHYERGKAWQEANREKSVAYVIKWRNANRGQHNAARRAHYAKNKERLKARVLEYQHSNPEEHRERSRRWAKENPEAHNAIKHKRRARKAKAGGSYTAAEWSALKQLFGNKCLCCGLEKPLTADHVVPIALGGSSDITNIQPLCKSCNSRKHTKAIDYRVQSTQSIS